MTEKIYSGLTVMELVVTMAILAMLIAVASLLIVPFSSGYRLRGAAREVVTDLQYARLLAVKENKEFRVVFHSSSYQVVRVSDGFIAKSNNFSTECPEITLSSLTVTFNPRGNSSSTTISVSNSTGVQRISVGSTGRVKWG